MALFDLSDAPSSDGVEWSDGLGVGTTTAACPRTTAAANPERRTELRRKTVDVQTRLLDDDPPEMRAQIQAYRRDAAPRRRMRLEWLRETAAHLGIDETEFQHGIPGGYENLLRQVGAEFGFDGPWRGRSCAGGWMFISGLSHPSFHRSFGSSINETSEVDGEFVVSTRPDPKFVFRTLKGAINIHLTAMRLFEQACAAPTPTSEDTRTSTLDDS